MGDLERSTERAGRLQTSAYQTARDRFSATMESAIERAERRRLEKERAKAEAALAAQQAAALARRDKQQNLYEMGSTNQRANIAAGQAAQDHQYATQREKQQQQGTLTRDQLQNQFTSQRDRQQAIDQQKRDAAEFGYSTQENAQQHGQQLERDAFQNQFTAQRDQTQFGQQLQRDFTQFGLDARKAEQQQGHTLERDYMQGGIQAQRDNRMNQFDTQRDVRQNQYQTERDVRQDRFQTQGDIRQQGFTQQNMYAREAADVSAKHQEQVRQLQNAGYAFSPQQEKKRKELESSFRTNVLNGNLPEDLKQRAYLEYQKKLSEILPEDKVSKPEDEIGQQFYNHPELGLLKRSRDSQGNPDWQPLGTGGQDPQMKAEKQAADKQAVQLRTMKRDRDKLFQQTHREVINEIDAESNKVFTDPDAIDKEVMNRLAADEIYYVESGLPPHDLFRASAEKEQQKASKYKNAQQNPQGPPQTRVNPYRQPTGGMGDSLAMRNGDAMPGQSPASNPIGKEIETTLKAAIAGNDKEAAVALQTVKAIIEQFNGSPPAGSQEMSDFMYAYNLLKKKNIAIPAPSRRKAGPPPSVIRPSEHMSIR